MALNRKHSRLIVVDGERYRWQVSTRPCPCRRCWGDDYQLTIQRADGSGQVISVTGSDVAATPRLVAEVIRAAQARGWTPQRSGSALRFGLVDGGLRGPSWWDGAGHYVRPKQPPQPLATWSSAPARFQPWHEALKSIGT
jgi:hypothetical protein